MADRNPRFILVTRKTRLQELVERFNTWPQAKFYLEHNHIDVSDYLLEHDNYLKQVNTAERLLIGMGRLLVLERSLIVNCQFGSEDIVVVLGQDGLVANTLKYLKGQPLIGVNPDPERWDGRLLPFTVDDLPAILQDTLKGKAATHTVTLAEATANDGQRMLAVNDIFIGPRTHCSARYRLHWDGKEENQSSSGIIVSTGLGSTGWLKSVIAGAQGISGTAGHTLGSGFAWEEQRLQFTVREPFPSNTTGVSLVFGAIGTGTAFRIESQMPENGVVFSDGMENDYIAFNSGTVLEVGISATQGRLVKH